MLDFTQIQAVDISIHTLVMLVFYFVLGTYAIFSAVLYYHWKTYGSDEKVTLYTLILFFTTTIPLLIIMGILAFFI